MAGDGIVCFVCYTCGYRYYVSKIGLFFCLKRPICPKCGNRMIRFKEKKRKVTL